MMVNLKQAINDGRLAEFVKEHQQDPKGDATAFTKALQSMAGKSKEARKASSAGNADD